MQKDRVAWWEWSMLALAVAVATLGMARLWGFLVDDSFISFRYAENLSDGAGLVFNHGERVEGYSNLLWVLMLSGAYKFGWATIASSRIIGGAAALAALVLTFGLRRQSRAPLAALLLATSLSWLLWAVSGMETLFYTLLLVLAAFGQVRARESRAWYWTASLAAASATLTRPEGLLLALAMGAAMALDLRGIPRRRALLWLALPVGFYLAQTFFRLAYYGEWLPNTFYAKNGPFFWQLSRGLSRYGDFFAERGWWAVFLFPAALGLWPAARRQPVALLCALLVCAQSAFFIKVGGDWMAFHRFLVPMLPFFFLLWQIGAETLAQRSPRRAMACAGIALCAAGAIYSGMGETQKGKETLWRYAYRYAHEYREALERTSIAVGKQLRLIAPPGATIALGDAGALPYYSRLNVIDLYGLINPELAHLPGNALYFDPASFDVNALIQRRPEFFYLNSMNDFMTRHEAFQPVPHLQIDAMIARNPIFISNYRWVESARFSAGYWCHLFARNDVPMEGRPR